MSTADLSFRMYDRSVLNISQMASCTTTPFLSRTQFFARLRHDSSMIKLEHISFWLRLWKLYCGGTLHWRNDEISLQSCKLVFAILNSYSAVRALNLVCHTDRRPVVFRSNCPQYAPFCHCDLNSVWRLDQGQDALVHTRTLIVNVNAKLFKCFIAPYWSMCWVARVEWSGTLKKWGFTFVFAP